MMYLYDSNLIIVAHSVEESGAKYRIHRIPVKPCYEIVQWGLEFRKNHKD